MRRIVVAGLLALFVVAPVEAAQLEAASPGARPGQSDALLRVAGRLSGIRAKRPVPLVLDRGRRFRERQVTQAEPVDLSSGHDETVLRALGLGPRTTRSALFSTRWRTALYHPGTRRVYATSLGPANRRALVATYVNALQDQAFAVARRARALADRDAAWAARAAVDGHASYVSGQLGVAGEPNAPTGRLERFLGLKAAFPATVGLRLVANLRNLGGNGAIHSALRRFPATTEQVFHLDKFLEREPPLRIVLPVDVAELELVGSQSWGELDIRALLAVYGIPRLDRAARGWGGGRTAVYGGAAGEAVVLALDWDSERDAAEWADAVARFVSVAFDARTPAPCAATICWDAGGRGIALAIDRTRTVLVLSGELALAERVAHALLP